MPELVCSERSWRGLHRVLRLKFGFLRTCFTIAGQSRLVLLSLEIFDFQTNLLPHTSKHLLLRAFQSFVWFLFFVFIFIFESCRGHDSSNQNTWLEWRRLDSFVMKSNLHSRMECMVCGVSHGPVLSLRPLWPVSQTRNLLTSCSNVCVHHPCDESRRTQDGLVSLKWFPV